MWMRWYFGVMTSIEIRISTHRWEVHATLQSLFFFNNDVKLFAGWKLSIRKVSQLIPSGSPNQPGPSLPGVPIFYPWTMDIPPVSSPIGRNPAGPRSQDVGMDPMTPLAQPRRGTRRPPVRLEEIALECLQLHFCLEGWMGALQVYMQISNLMETINGQKVGKGLNVVEPVEILSGSQQPKEDKHHAQHMRKLTNVGAKG